MDKLDNDDNNFAATKPAQSFVTRIRGDHGQPHIIPANELPDEARSTAAVVQGKATTEDEKADALRHVEKAIAEAKRTGANQQEIADAVLKSMGVIMGKSPFDKSTPMRGWGG